MADHSEVVIREAEPGDGEALPRLNVLVQDDSDGGHEFWVTAGYEVVASRQYGRTLRG